MRTQHPCRNWQYLIVLLLSATAHGQYTTEINANRPSQSTGAFAVGKTVFQVEVGLQAAKVREEDLRQLDYGGLIQLRYGAFFEQLELNADLNYSTNYSPNARVNGFSSLSLGAKYLIYDPFKNYEEKINVYSWKANQRFKWRRLIPAVSVYVGADFATDQSFFPDAFPSAGPKALLIAQQHFSDKWALITNVVLEQLSSDVFRSYGYVVTLTHGLNSRWSIFVENQGHYGDFRTEVNFRAGAATLLNKNLQLDLAAGLNRSDATHSYLAQMGLSWRFDKKHSPLVLK